MLETGRPRPAIRPEVGPTPYWRRGDRAPQSVTTSGRLQNRSGVEARVSSFRNPGSQPRTDAPAAHTFRVSGYTLIELLAVMAIIAIIMLIAVAAYTGMTRGAAPRKAAENVESALSLARQYAVARNTPVLFVILDKGFNTRNPGPYPDGLPIVSIGPTRGRHYAVFDPSNRVYVTGWTELPPGVVFDDTYRSDTVVGRNVLSNDDDMFYNRDGNRAMIPFPSTLSVDTNRLVTLPGIAFKTDGTVRLRGTLGGSSVFSLRVNLAEGSVDAAGTVTVRPGGIKYGVRVSMLGHAVVEDNNP